MASELLGIIAEAIINIGCVIIGKGPKNKKKSDPPPPEETKTKYASRNARLIDRNTNDVFHLLRTGVTRIGRANDDNDITFVDYGDISRWHCEITSVANGYSFSVVKTTKDRPGGENNTTEIKSEFEDEYSRVDDKQRRTLKCGDIIRLGSHYFEFRDDEYRV